MQDIKFVHEGGEDKEGCDAGVWQTGSHQESYNNAKQLGVLQDIRPMTDEIVNKAVKDFFEKTPALKNAIASEYTVFGFKIQTLIEGVLADVVRSSLRALLLHVLEEMPESMTVDPDELPESINITNMGYNKCLSDCKRVIEKMIEEL